MISPAARAPAIPGAVLAYRRSFLTTFHWRPRRAGRSHSRRSMIADGTPLLISPEIALEPALPRARRAMARQISPRAAIPYGAPRDYAICSSFRWFISALRLPDAAD